ncbi:cation efflux family protein [Xylona heveae TC161]|uniref:Cation efflux family protein n=1 Tax=Xylona heveae (strain CBS 132557 / TC161) TaxID=1328760 RepID=A0A165ILD9_XYLHT|nr:cation efflux family protein [Xylona heveae TC161]KZF25063.1 cation efflux family protein [Xylona heveae TC161]
MGTQKRTHIGHSHGHHHHHENTYLISTNKKDAGVRITRVGLFVNLGMAVGKGVGGYYFHSQALVADAIHSLTDLVSDVMTLATVSWSLKPPSSQFPSGYGKVESLGSLGVSGLLFVGGIWMGINALGALGAQLFPDFMETLAQLGIFGHSHGHGHGHSHSHTDLGPNINAAWLAGGSIVIKEWLYRATIKIARERKSSVLASNAVHHRIDSLTALVALVMIGGSHFLEHAAWLDPVGGAIISLMVIRAGFSNSKAALMELADAGVDDEMRDSVKRAALKALKSDYLANFGSLSDGQQVEVRDVQGIKSGQNYLMDVELSVPSDWTLERTHPIEEAVRLQIGSKVRGVRRVRVRFVAHERQQSDFVDEFIRPELSTRGSPEPEEDRENHNHDDHHERDHGQTHTHQLPDSNAHKRR